MLETSKSPLAEGSISAAPAQRPPAVPAPARLRLRRVWLLAHGWIGLTAGAVMALFGLTGALLVLGGPLLRWELGPTFAPARAATPGLDPARIDADIAAARAANPEISSLDGIYAAHTTPLASEAIIVLAHLESAGGERHFVIPVDPATGVAAAGAVFEETWAGFILSLHMGLVPWGYTVVGIAGVLLVVSAITGVLLWWPFARRWRAALPAPGDARPRERWLHWHNFAGVWLLIPTVVVTLTGLWLLQPAWVDPVASALSPLTPVPAHDAFHARIAESAQPALSLGTLAAGALAAHPGHALMGVTAPHEPGDPVQLRLHPLGTREPRRGGTDLWLHPATGEVLGARLESQFTASDTAKAWARPIHADLGLGLPGAILVFLAGLSLPALYLTGAWLWWKRTFPARSASLRLPA